MSESLWDMIQGDAAGEYKGRATLNEQISDGIYVLVVELDVENGEVWPEFYVRVQWCDRGSKDMLRYYGLSVVGGDLTWTLKESQYDCGTVIGDDPEAALAVLSKEEARAVRRADLALGLDETIKYLKPALAKHYAGACVEVWRRAELEHSDLEEDFSKKNSELVAAHGRLQKDARAAPSAYARLKAIAEEVCARSDEARSDADRQKEIAIEAVLMLRNVAPGVSLFPDVPALSGLRF
ncbi:hypothetical protein [Devosia alba]|uniref:hypothetical protein n=1 Tax=Devosia alba TaxID=3152360 RepID=UPI0032664F35